MTEAEISRRLALAIGWQDDDEDPDVILMNRLWNSEETKCYVWFNDLWVEFDYRDPAVIWPIAERFNAFPVVVNGNWWMAYFGNTVIYSESDTAAKAVALAVIKAHEEKK
jgi:hypothetical protein